MEPDSYPYPPLSEGGNLAVDLAQRVVTLAGEEVALTSTEYEEEYIV